MTEFQDQASVAPATVTAISRGEHLQKKQRTRRPKQEAPIYKQYSKRPSWLNEEVWDTALELANGDFRRLEVIGAADIIVHNPGWSPK